MEENVSCRILLVPSSRELGISLIKQIINEKARTSPQDNELRNDDQLTEKKEDADETQKLTRDLNYIPWTISNKYYTADVHFRLADWNTLAPSLKSGIPAVVVVWEKGEDYTAILGRYALEWERLQPEVLLAIATGSQDIDQEKVEGFCSEVGFEFIDADADLDLEDGSDDAGVPRVREALQTIMWPSMQLKTKPKRESYTRGHRSQESIDRGTRNVGIMATTGTEKAEPSIANEVDQAGEVEYSLEREKQKLEAWLTSDDDPWPKRDTAPKINPNAALDPTSTSIAAFDDDFTEFVSAPANPNSDPDLSNSQNQQISDEEDDGDNFHFDDEDAGYKELFDDGMPTSEEIMLTSQRIFGPAFAERIDKGNIGEPSELDEMGEDEPGEFDLGSIMGALQNMKDEISAITDEDAKRRAAARVALGLVWGLEGTRH